MPAEHAPPDLRLPPDPAVVQATIDLLRKAEGRIRLVVAGGSMAPLLHAGDWVVVQLGPGQHQVGDVVVARSAQGLVAHRIVRRICSTDRPAYVTKGDAAFGFDSPIAPSDILGQVVEVERAGWQTLDLSRPVWRLLGMALGLLSSLQGWLYALLSARLHTLGRHSPARWIAHITLRLSDLVLNVAARVALRFG